MTKLDIVIFVLTIAVLLVLGAINSFQETVIEGQRNVIRKMAENPACLVAPMSQIPHTPPAGKNPTSGQPQHIPNSHGFPLIPTEN